MGKFKTEKDIIIDKIVAGLLRGDLSHEELERLQDRYEYLDKLDN